MKRRNVLLGASAVLAAPAIIGGRANAQSASALGSTLTPFGADPKASASGLVPAYTGGITTPPSDWTMGTPPPHLFKGEAPIFTVTVENMSQYSDMLCDGQKLMLTRYGSDGFKLNVYPNKRNFAAPQYVYDNTVKNVTRAQPSSAGLLYGFTGAVGGVPFPIPSADPVQAAMQIMWNHGTRYQGQYQAFAAASQWVCSHGANVLALTEQLNICYPYYFEGVTPETYNNLYYHSYLTYVAPANQVGGKFNTQSSTDRTKVQNTAFEYLVGEGRIREAPSAEYDVPATQANDACNYDEIYVFSGSLDRYNWKLVGKKEMIVNYNTYDRYHAQPDSTTLMTNFVNPDLVRWEVHRCYVIEATLAPGKRHSMPHRRFYVDEDTWLAVMADGWDAQGNYWRLNFEVPQFNFAPEGPVPCYVGQEIYNFQTNQYIVLGNWYDAPPPEGGPGTLLTPLPASMFNPDSMADSGGL